MNGSTRGVFRRGEVANYSPSGNGSAVTPGGTENVIFANHIHHNGDPLDPEERDIHGVAPKEGSSRIWILDNHMHDNGGDSIQVGSAVAGEPWARFIYIGRNEMHDDRENAVDIKQSRDVIVSQNRVYGYVPPPSHSDDGTAIVVHDNPDRVWVLFNRVSDSTNGIRCTGARDGFYAIGNVVWNIRHLPGSSYNPDSMSGTQGIRAYGTPVFAALNNTIYGSDAGISFSSGSGAEIANNVVAGLAQASHHVAVASSTGNVLKNNIFDAVARIRFGSSTVRNCAQTQSAYPSQVQNCINEDPDLVDPDGLDFHLLDGSPAVDRGYVPTAYARYQSLYGINISRDADGAARPQGAAFDLGSYEGESDATPSTVSVGDVTVTEGHSGSVSAVFTVSLTPASTQPVTVSFATANATATAGPDYTAVSGTLTFPAGTTTRTVAVPVLGDTLVEGDETFWLDLGSASGATVGDGQGRGLIRDDDAAPVPSLSISDVSVTEGHSGAVSAVFNVTLSAASTQAVTAAFSTTSGTALAPSDYTAASGTLSFPAGTVSRTVTVAVVGDTTVEPNETFNVDLSSIVGATLLDGRGVGTIVNDDSATGSRFRFVDTTLTVASCTTYNPATRTCAGGVELGYRTIAAAAAAAVAGDTVALRAGTYGERLVPPTSGTAAQPITYARYQSEVATITGSSFDPAIDLTGRSYLVLDGLRVDNVVGWLRAVNAHHNVIRNSTFRRATGSGTRAGLKFIDSTYNRIENNTIEDGNDNLMLIHSDRNVVQSNTFRRARHSLWTILCGNRNVVRGNSFHNELQKIGQVTDCEGVPSDSPQLYNATKRNLVEGNTFAFTPSSGNASPYAGIQYSAQQGIIRRNIFRDTVGPGLDLTLYSNEARYNTDNRVYHNVFYKTSFAGISIAQTSSYTFTGNVIKNNVLHKSQFVANDTRWTWYTQTLAGKPVQFLTGRQDGFLFERNDILGTAAGQTYAVTYGRRDSSSNPPGQNLAWWHQNQPALFKSNLEVLPGFVNEDARDFRLTAESPLVDAGAFLTTTASAGSGTVMPVADVTYFFDGYGIAGEVGDYVQLAGQAARARIVSINESNRTLQLDRALSWTAGQGVALAFNGSAPDVGAIER
jgi:parallel beta-helix repeat protein